MINKQKGSSTALMLIIIVLLLVIIFGGFYLMIQKDSDSKIELDLDTEEMMLEKETVTDTAPTPTKATGTTGSAPKAPATNTQAPTNTGSTNTTGTVNATTAVSFNGNWSGLSLPKELDSGCTGSTINVNINGTKITGTAKDPISGVTGVVTGSVTSEGKVSSVFTFGGGLTVNWSGTLSGDKGSGSWNASDGCKGTWSLKR